MGWTISSRTTCPRWPTDGKENLTLHHLLTQTSGLEWYEWGGGYSNWSEFRSAGNWVDYILGRKLIHQPGTVFNYSTGNTHLLSAVLQSATGMTQEQYCREKLFAPMGISRESHWVTAPRALQTAVMAFSSPPGTLPNSVSCF